MSPKKIMLLIIVLVLGGGVILLRSAPTEAPTVPGPQTQTQAQAPEVPTVDPIDRSTPAISAVVNNDTLKLQDPDREPKLRIKTIRELKLAPVVTPDAAELVSLVVSVNPIPSGTDPHSATSYQHQREAAVRVYALRRLSEELDLENFEQIVLEIEQQASDAAIVNIAREALKAKRRGGNYFAEMTQGIRSMPLAD